MSLRLLIYDCVSKGIGLVIMAPERMANVIKEKYVDHIGKRLWLIETDDPHGLKIVNSSNEDQAYVWISTCNQANLISAIGEHNAVMLGYAEG